jgi:hypothetical protein
MSGTSIARGNLRGINQYSLTLSPVSVAANTTAEQTFTFNGLNVNDFVEVNLQGASIQAGLSIANTRVSAANTLAITFGNATASAITPTGSSVYTLLHFVSEYNPLQTAT